MGVTLYLDGAFTGLAGGFKIKNALGGALAPSGQKLVHVDTPGSTGDVSNAGAATAMNTLFDLIVANLSLATVSDPMVIAGHSNGAQVIAKLLRERGADLLAALTAVGKGVNVLKFVLMGFPESKFTGVCYLRTALNSPVLPGDPANGGVVHTADCPTPPAFHGGYGIGYGLPLTCPWTVNVVANQYDGWAHAPTNPSSPFLSKVFDYLLGLIPRKVWDDGLFVYLKSATGNPSTSGPHGRYDMKNAPGLSDPGAVSYTDPAQTTVTYWLIRTYPFPGFDKIIKIRFMARDQDMRNRATIDAAYAATDSTHGQQVPVPAPDYTAVSTWFPLS